MFKFIGTREQRTFIYNTDDKNSWNRPEDYVPNGEYCITEIIKNGHASLTDIKINPLNVSAAEAGKKTNM